MAMTRERERERESYRQTDTRPPAREIESNVAVTSLVVLSGGRWLIVYNGAAALYLNRVVNVPTADVDILLPANYLPPLIPVPVDESMYCMLLAASAAVFELKPIA